jgi:hypothetical protein
MRSQELCGREGEGKRETEKQPKRVWVFEYASEVAHVNGDSRVDQPKRKGTEQDPT